MSDRRPLGEIGHAGDDVAVPFQVDALDARGRAIQLGEALDRILARHDYPDAVARLLGEMVTLTVLLGTSLKFQGRFTVQAEMDGPVDLLVVDLATPGDIRAYARYDEARLVAASRADALIGRGTLAMTVDQGPQTTRYQGLVALEGQSLEDAARAYFRQSEQIPTDVRLAVARHSVQRDGAWHDAWRAGGLLVQFLPEDRHRARLPDLPGGDGDDPDALSMVDDAWAEVTALTASIGDDELTDPEVGVERLLYRLFHERGVRVFEGVTVADRCRCSREKLGAVIGGFTAEEIADCIEDGAILARCEFCSAEYRFDPEEFAAT